MTNTANNIINDLTLYSVSTVTIPTSFKIFASKHIYLPIAFAFDPAKKLIVPTQYHSIPVEYQILSSVVQKINTLGTPVTTHLPDVPPQ